MFLAQLATLCLTVQHPRILKKSCLIDEPASAPLPSPPDVSLPRLEDIAEDESSSDQEKSLVKDDHKGDVQAKTKGARKPSHPTPLPRRMTRSRTEATERREKGDLNRGRLSREEKEKRAQTTREYNTMSMLDQISEMGKRWIQIRETVERGRGLRAIAFIPKGALITAMPGTRLKRTQMRKDDIRYWYMIGSGKSDRVWVPTLEQIQDKHPDLRMCAHLSNHTSSTEKQNAKLEPFDKFIVEKAWKRDGNPPKYMRDYVAHLTATRNIEPGEEIRWNYGDLCHYPKGWKASDLCTTWREEKEK
jgi:hypothetical protein